MVIHITIASPPGASRLIQHLNGHLRHKLLMVLEEKKFEWVSRLLKLISGLIKSLFLIPWLLLFYAL